MNKKRKTFKEHRNQRENKKFFMDILFFIVILSVSVFFALTFFLSRILIKGDNISSLNGYSAQTIISGSMVPTLEVYDVIIVKADNNYQVGDVITFYVPNEEGEFVCYTHRIVSCGDGFYKTQGDANQEWDDWDVYKQNVVGKINYRIPKIGKVVLEFSKIPLSTYKIAIIITFSVLILFIILDTIKAATAEFTEKELQMLEIKKYKNLNFKMKVHVFTVKIKYFIQTKIMKRQI